MTEQEWQESKDLYKMLKVLKGRGSLWRWTTRKARLFSCGCCRRIWTILTEPDQRAAVEAAEQVADKIITIKDLAVFHNAAKLLIVERRKPDSFSGWTGHRDGDFWLEFNKQGELSCNPGRSASIPRPWASPYYPANDCRTLLYYRSGKKKSDAEVRLQCDLLRDIVGPITLPVLKPAWLTANDNAVTKLAQKIYDKRTFGQLPKLADALQAAGCKDKLLLDHLRSRGPHARGCWAVDLLLGKK